MSERGMWETIVAWFRSVGAWFAPSDASKQVAFTIAFVGLAAKLAKADGVAVAVEVEAFERCFYVPPSERANVKRVFELASRDVAGFETYADQIAKQFSEDRALLRDVFECLFNIAAADGIIHDAEEAFLRTVADRFGFSDEEYASVRHLFVADPGNPYQVLGVAPDIDDRTLKVRYRALVVEYHPDKLVAAGVPQEFLVLADRKLAVINAAYDQILKERKSREPGGPAEGDGGTHGYEPGLKETS